MGTGVVRAPLFRSKILRSLTQSKSDEQRPLWRNTLVVLDDSEEPLFCVLMRLAAVNQG